MRVADLMDPKPPVARPDDERGRLLALLREHKVPGLPIVKEPGHRLVGLVLRATVVRDPNADRAMELMDPNPFTIYAQAPLAESAQAMVHARVPLLPVVSGANELLGTVSANRLLEGLRSHRSRLQVHLQGRAIPVHRTAPARVAVEIQRVTGARALPVLDDEGRLAGLLTDGDLLALTPAQSATPVQELMTRSPQVLRDLDTVGAAATLMVQRGYGQVPILDSAGRLVDLLTDLDLLSAWL